MSSTYYICWLFTNGKHIHRFVLWNSSKTKKLYNKYKIKSDRCQIKNKLPYRIGLQRTVYSESKQKGTWYFLIAEIMKNAVFFQYKADCHSSRILQSIKFMIL